MRYVFFSVLDHTNILINNLCHCDALPLPPCVSSNPTPKSMPHGLHFDYALHRPMQSVTDAERLADLYNLC